MEDNKKNTYTAYNNLAKKREFCESLIWLGRTGLREVNNKEFTCTGCGLSKTIMGGSVNGYGEFICNECMREEVDDHGPA